MNRMIVDEYHKLSGNSCIILKSLIPSDIRLINQLQKENENNIKLMDNILILKDNKPICLNKLVGFNLFTGLFLNPDNMPKTNKRVFSLKKNGKTIQFQKCRGKIMLINVTAEAKDEFETYIYLEPYINKVRRVGMLKYNSEKSKTIINFDWSVNGQLMRLTYKLSDLETGNLYYLRVSEILDGKELRFECEYNNEKTRLGYKRTPKNKIYFFDNTIISHEHWLELNTLFGLRR